MSADSRHFVNSAFTRRWSACRTFGIDSGALLTLRLELAADTLRLVRRLLLYWRGCGGLGGRRRRVGAAEEHVRQTVTNRGTYSN